MAFQFPTPPPLEQTGGLASGMAEGQQLFSPMIQEMRARQQFPLQQQQLRQQVEQEKATDPLAVQQLHQQIAEARQRVRQGEASFPLAQQLTHATIRHLRAQAAQLERDETGSPLSETGKMIADWKRMPAGSPQKDMMRQSIDAYTIQKHNAAMSPAEKALEQRSAVNFADLQKDAGDKASIMQKNLDDMKIFKTDYPKAGFFATGFFHSKDHPKLSKKVAYMTGTGKYYNSAEKAANRLGINIMKAMHIGRINIRLQDKINESTVGMGTSTSGVRRIIPQLQIAAKRTIEFPKFLHALKQAGVTDAGQANSLWQQYVNKYPGINEAGHPSPENIGKWREFIPKGGQQMVGIRLPNGKTARIPFKNVAKAIEMGAKRL